ncbi:MAG: FAD-dependent monooxygenase, partial [Holophagales bacterium]|nr:FAD-dependent monooxygenase [Holophagales bacterium]
DAVFDRLRGAFLIGADGIGSAIRAQLLADGRPLYRQSTAWRGIVDEGEGTAPGLAFVLWGRGRRFGSFPVDGGQQCWFAVTPSPPGDWDEERSKSWLLDYFDGAARPTRPPIERTPEGTLLRTDLLFRRPIDTWGRGRVTLLGDAAHAMAPTLAQGAAQAIEDGIVLAASLQDSADPAAGLDLYAQRRRPRSRWMVKQSELLNTMTAWRNPAVCWLRDRMTGLAGPWTQKRMRWSMTFDY